MSAKKRSQDEDNTEILQEKLQSVKGREGIIGYILRGSNSASIDLKDPTKIIDYAVLSATAFETGQNISDIFEIGEIDTILLEGENTKILASILHDHRLSIFMEKNVNHSKLRKDLKLT